MASYIKILNIGAFTQNKESNYCGPISLIKLIKNHYQVKQEKCFVMRNVVLKSRDRCTG